MDQYTGKKSRTIVGLVAAGAVVAATADGAAGVSRNLSVHGGATQLSGDQSKAVKAAIDSGRADNVILVIGDGMGDSEITSARHRR